MSPGPEKRRKEKHPGDTHLLGLVSPHHPLAIRQLLVPVVVIPSPFVVISSPSFSSSHPHRSPLAVRCCLVPVVLPLLFVVVSSPSFSSSHPRHSPLAIRRPHVPVVVVHPWSTLRAAVGVGAGSPSLSIVQVDT